MPSDGEGAMMALTGMAHVAITVTDLARSKEWYAKVLDWKPVMEGGGDGVQFALGAVPDGVLIGLREYADGPRDAFDPTRIGLDHLALQVSSADELAEWERRFAELGVTYTPTQHEAYGHVLNFKDPDDIALEVYAAP
jgi:catechol 2,3-dioxygenase-like lactoylglutathione lyase family enzyme